MRNLTRPVQRLADTLHDSVLHLRVKCLKLFDSRGHDVALTFDGENYQQLLIGGEVFADSGMGARAEAAAVRAENAIAILDVYEDKAAASAASAESAEEMARRWAELSTPPIEGDVTRKSAKTWAETAQNAAVSAESSAHAAQQSETTAKGYVDTYAGLTAEAATLAPGSAATAEFSAVSGKLTLGVPQGDVGPMGPPVPLSDSVTTDDSTLGASSRAVKTVNNAVASLRSDVPGLVVDNCQPSTRPIRISVDNTNISGVQRIDLPAPGFVRMKCQIQGDTGNLFIRLKTEDECPTDGFYGKSGDMAVLCFPTGSERVGNRFDISIEIYRINCWVFNLELLPLIGAQ